MAVSGLGAATGNSAEIVKGLAKALTDPSPMFAIWQRHR